MPNLQRPNTKISCGRLLHSDRLRLCFRKERRKSCTEMRAQLKEYDANRVRKWEPTWKNTMQIVEGKREPSWKNTIQIVEGNENQIKRIRSTLWKELKTQLKEYDANRGRKRGPNWKNTTQIVEGKEGPIKRIPKSRNLGLEAPRPRNGTFTISNE